MPTEDGAFVVNEPQGSPGWYPANDTPRDKATYTIAMTVPAGITAVGNGALVSQTSAGGRTTFTWRERFPMAPYLTTITLGKFAVTTGRAGGIPTYVAVDPSQASRLGARPAQAARDGGVPAGPVRALPVRDGRRDRRRRAGGRVRAGDADEARVRPRPRRHHAAARALAPVVRRRRHPAAVARHLAARGLRHLVGVDLGRAARRPDGRAAVRRAGRDPGERRRLLEPAARRPGRGGEPLRRARSTTAAR